MKRLTLKNSLTFGAIAISMFSMLVAMTVMTLIINLQNTTASHDVLKTAFNVIIDDLSVRQVNLLADTRQLASMEGVDAQIKLLTANKSQIDATLTRDTYRKLTSTIYNIGLTANVWKIAMYDRDGDLVSFAIIAENNVSFGYAQGFPHPVFQIASLRPDEPLTQESWRQKSTIQGIDVTFGRPVPEHEIVGFQQVEQFVCLVSFVPVMGWVFNKEKGEVEPTQLGVVMAVQSLDTTFVARMSRLTGTSVHIFTGNRLSVGEITAYPTFDPHIVGEIQEQWELTPDKIVLTDITINDSGYFQGIFPLYTEMNYVGAIAALYSKEVARANTLQMIKILVFVAFGCIGLIVPLAMMFSNALTTPLGRIIEAGKKIAKGELNSVSQTEQDATVSLLKKGYVPLEIGALVTAFQDMIVYLQDMAYAAGRVSTGNLSYAITPRTGDDVLGTAFQRMSAYLNEMAAAATEIAAGDLQQHIQPKSEDDVLGNAFHLMGIQLHENFEEIRQKNVELERLDKLKDEFLANTSHELRTPLNGIIGIAESMLDGAAGPLTEEQQYNLSLIVSSGRRLTNLINDILDFSKLRYHDLQLQKKPVDIRSIAEIVLLLSHPLTHNKPIRLINQIPPELPAVDTDENRVQQILHNLVDNAIKFTKVGMVVVSARFHGTFLAITVSDTGIGIPSEQFHEIFEAFQQADGSIAREYGGTGLGLSVTKHLVELNGGQIWVDSQVGNGSAFTFTLPLSQQEAQQTQATDFLKRHTQIARLAEHPIEFQSFEVTEMLPVEVASGEGQLPRILVVDDEPVNLQVLRNYLAVHDYAVTLTTNGEDALRVFERSQSVDLVLLDVMMPRMSGYEVCQRLREHYSANQLPIIMLTAKNRIDDLVAGFKAGANDYLTKPFSKAELLARVNTHLQLKQFHEELEQLVQARTAELAQTKADLELMLQMNLEHAEYVEQELFERIDAALRESEQRFRVITETIPLPVLVSLRSDQTIVYANHPAASFFGFPVKTLVGQQITAFYDTAEQWRLADILAAQDSVKNYELRGQRVNGTPFWGAWFIQRLIFNEEPCLLSVLYDMTERKQAEEALRTLNEELEQRVEARTGELQKTNRALQESLHTLELAQDQLVQSEKMAALGGLVAGVAHEINTPVGVGVTATSYLVQKTQEIRDLYEHSQMTRSDLENYLQIAEESSNIVLKNLKRAAEQIRSFKQVAVDQTSGESRRFKLKPYFDDLLLSLHPHLRKLRPKVKVLCPENLEITSYPGAFSQIFTNLILNSLIHGFEHKSEGEIVIKVTCEPDTLRIQYSDNGSGMTEDMCSRIFEPFYTTKRGQGGTGLGLYIVYNLVTQRLQGNIACESVPGANTTFIIQIPLEEQGEFYEQSGENT